MTTIAKLPMSDVTRNLELKICVTGVKTWRVRLWLGALLMRFAAWVIGCKCEVEVRK